MFPLARIWTLLDSFEAVRRFVAHGRADGGVDGQGQEGAIGHPVSDAADVLVQEKNVFQRTCDGFVASKEPLGSRLNYCFFILTQVWVV